MASLARLLRADSAEFAFRGKQLARIALERVNVATGRERWNRDRLATILSGDSHKVVSARSKAAIGQWKDAHDLLREHFSERPPRFPLNPAERESVAQSIRERFPPAPAQAVAMASPLIEHRFELLGYSDLSFASALSPVDWHLDPVHERRAPRRFWSDVTFLDPACGDHKIIWELNRHQHWLTLGRAAWLTNDPRYGSAFRRELASWLEANPPLLGINWASMLELAFRAISWVWALHFFCGDGEDDAADPWVVDLLVGLDRQLDHIADHLSTYFSPNTHLLGEGVALYVAGRALPELASARRWESIGRAVLLHEAHAQVLDDGGHAELSLHYHRYALDFYLLSLAVARRTGDQDDERLAEVTARLASFCRAMADESGCLPTIGDDDGGMVFPICGRRTREVRDSLGLAAVLLDDPRLAVGPASEEVLWMLGGAARAGTYDTSHLPPTSRVFHQSGYVVMRAGGDHAILDAGRHGFLNGGHAHADALSLVLSIDQRPLLIDPGTATYTIAPAIRDRFRTTAMHNTLVVDGQPQSLPAGPFHWAATTNASLDVTSFAGTFDYAEAFHDGYAPLVHRRAVLRAGDHFWLVADHLHGSGPHGVDAYWHIDSAWTCGRTTSKAAELVHADGSRAWLGSTAGHLRTFRGDQDGLGWSSPIYGRTIESTTLRFSYADRAPLSVVTAIAAASSTCSLALEVLQASIDRQDGWQRIAVSISRPDASDIATDIALFASPSNTVETGAVANRTRHRITTGHGDLITDARAALLTLSPRGEPVSLIVINASAVVWTGPKAFERTWDTARDLHLDMAHRHHRRVSSCVA
jgi:hypothetical protein